MKKLQTVLIWLFALNVIWGIICAIPAFFVIGFTIEGWFPPSYQHPDSFIGPPSSGNDLYLLTIASIIFIAFYSNTFFGAKGFEVSECWINKYQNHFLLNIFTVIAGSLFIIYIFGIEGKSLEGTLWLLLIPLILLYTSLKGFWITEKLLNEKAQ